VHFVGLALAVWALCLVLRRFFRCDDLIAQVLAVAILINVVAYLMSTTPTTYWSAREIAGVLPAGAVLAGRMLVGRLRVARLVPALAVVLACYVAALGYTVAEPTVPAISQDLADFLAANHLTYGLSSYGLANTTTLASGGGVDLRPVSWYNADVGAGPYEFNASWYNPQTHDANFIVLMNPPGPLDPIARWEVLDRFGPAARTYDVGPYVIMVYDTNLLSDFSPSLPNQPAAS
jgi:peptidoglycan/LPS O-acetylase OafA/YrhL